MHRSGAIAASNAAIVVGKLQGVDVVQQVDFKQQRVVFHLPDPQPAIFVAGGQQPAVTAERNAQRFGLHLECRQLLPAAEVP